MKRLTSLLLAIFIITGIIPSAFAAYTDADPYADYYDSTLRLQDLGVLNGYDDGSFRPDNSITRAEFTKIVICMMDKDTEARAAGSYSSFFDVPGGSWFAPYINYAVTKDILSGYSDGSFGPYKTISLAEAVTILMRTLGYSEESVGYYWPNNYMSAAASLGMTEGINPDSNAQLTRASAAILVDRAMFTKPSGQNQNADTYLDTLGCTVLDDALILDKDKSSNNVTVLAGNLKLNNAQTYILKSQLEINEGDVFEHAVIDKNGYLAGIRKYGSTGSIASQTAIINKVTENNIEYTATDGRKGVYKADNDFIIYSGSSKMTFASAKSLCTNGTDITFYGNSYGAWNIAVVGSSSDVDPVLASKNYTDTDTVLEGIDINKTNLVIYRNGEAASLSDIQVNDVVYYNTRANIIDVYSKKVTGSYYSASPSKAYVESVTVGGKSYEIGYSAATSKLDASSGAFAIGDKITLLLGKNDKIAFVTDNSTGFDYFEYGVLLSTSTRTAAEGANEGNTEFIATMFMADGQEHDIVTDKLYKDHIGRFMRITYSGGVASLNTQSNSGLRNYEGTISLENRTIADRYVLKDAIIFQLTSDSDAAVASCELLDFDSLTSKSINTSQLINVVTANKFGDIAILFVKDLESTSQFGVISGFVKTGSETTGYKIFSDGASASYMLSNISTINTSAGSGVAFRAGGGTITSISPMYKIAGATSIGAVEGGRIMLSGTIYKLADKVQIVDVTGSEKMREYSIDELARMTNITSVTLYSDKSLSNGGVARIITVTTSNK
ncbi:MAG: S-layer homology domain-containing protein [Clostridiales bacterium]|nr:S-layer homology domain-containing protein [Clostridiales bacterium]